MDGRIDGGDFLSYSPTISQIWQGCKLVRCRVTLLRLIHDIPVDHHRVPHFRAMAKQVAAASAGEIRVIEDPNRIRFPGFESIKALEAGEADIACVNAVHLERLDPRLAFTHQPFGIDDDAMGEADRQDRVIDRMNVVCEALGLRVIGLMRGADLLFAFRNDFGNSLADMAGLKIRVAGDGGDRAIVERLRGVPVVLPIPALKSEFAKGKIDGVFTSPGAWASQIGMAAPYALHVPGLMLITYPVLMRSDAFAALPSVHRDHVLAAAAECVTRQWNAMRAEDEALIAALVSQGARFSAPSDVSEWKETMSEITENFIQKYPNIFKLN